MMRSEECERDVHSYFWCTVTNLFLLELMNSFFLDDGLFFWSLDLDCCCFYGVAFSAASSGYDFFFISIFCFMDILNFSTKSSLNFQRLLFFLPAKPYQ